MRTPLPRWQFLQRKPSWRWLLPLLLMLLFLSVVLWLPWQAQRMEANERQEQLIADTLWVEQTIRFQLARDEESLRLLAAEISSGFTGPSLRDRMTVFLRNNRELARIAEYDAAGHLVIEVEDGPLETGQYPPPVIESPSSRDPHYGPPHRAPGRAEPVLMDYTVPLYAGDQYIGMLVASYTLSGILSEMVPWWFAQDNAIAILDRDDNVVAKRESGGAGRGVYTHTRALDLAGTNLTLSTNSVKPAPKLLPSLLVASVIALSVGLAWSLWALWRDINRRLAAEGALRQQVAFRTAMENSLMTGLRARDLEGRITYVNPAFCDMVGIPAEQLVGRRPPMAYWAPEAFGEYQQRFSQVLAGRATPQYETIFQRANGERFPVLIFESPLVDETGKQTGWMGSILDISDRKKAEALNRQQQEKLQASARLATMGELASTLAHELNQPLAAISSYATGALNLLKQDNFDRGLLQSALEKAAAQAQRAGQIIRSVHTFVKRREPSRAPLAIRDLLDRLQPLVELQAREHFVATQVQVDAGLPRVLADPVLLEQVMLNLTRNAIESMHQVAPERRILRIVAEVAEAAAGDAQPGVAISVIDQGHGIPKEVAARLFSPFFSTKAEGMGMGLNICRSAVEFHGGTLVYLPNPAGGTIFRVTLPALMEEARREAEVQG
jgi:two-component system sensor histidine kinase DctS